MEKNRVIEFTQTATNTKTFRHDYPISDELKRVMIGKVLNDFMKYALDRYYLEYLPILKEFVDDHSLQAEKQDGLLHNLFWWRIFYDMSLDYRSSCVADYIAENYHWLRKRPILISWLKECKKAIPKFYYVGYKHNDRALVLVDILTEKTIDAVVYDPMAIPPQKGEIAMGTLIPLGNGLYFPIIDFYHFQFEARKDIAMHLQYYYEKHLKTSTMHEAFIHVLSAMLQIEKIISTENTSK